MYRVLVGHDIEPIATEADVLAWRERENVFIAYIDRATRRLARSARVMPIGFDSRHPEYYRRYVCRPLGGPKRSCFSVGVRDPFVGFSTPVWFRFHHATPFFAEIRDRLRAAGPVLRIVESDGHVWIPLDVPLCAEANTVVDSLVEQAEFALDITCHERPRKESVDSLD